MVLHPKFVVDEDQNRQAVLLSYEEWENIVEEIEELDDIRAYDQAKSRPSDAVSFDDAVKEIRKGDAL
jgi:PHD/YefM family antitoxin component YafN of YafNO toxin-antitoxin module